MIRPATITDHPWITELAAQVYDDLGDYGTIIPSWLSHPGVLAYIDEDMDTRRGFILLGFYEPSGIPSGSYVADLLAIAVEPSWQRRGVGRSLLNHAIHLAELAGRSNPIPEIRLTVSETNPVGRDLFDSAGFEILSSSHGSYDGGQTAIRMRRPLVSARRVSASR